MEYKVLSSTVSGARVTIVGVLPLCTMLLSCDNSLARRFETVQKTIAFTTDEVTGMELDVSPDGMTIVFEALGDIYTVPVKGGHARLLVGGAAWDKHPRYSPDGVTVAFVSDRGGGNALWAVNLESGALRAISQPGRHRLGHPSWSNTGRAIYADREDDNGGYAIWHFPVAQDSAQAVSLEGLAEHPLADPSGHHLYYFGNRVQVMRAPREGGSPIPITNPPTRCGDRLALSRDGRAIAYSCLEEKGFTIYLQDVGTGRKVPVYRIGTPYPDRIELSSPAFAFAGKTYDLVVADRGGLYFLSTTFVRTLPAQKPNSTVRIPLTLTVHLSVANRDESEPYRRTGPDATLPLWPQIAPDGQNIVAVQSGQLRVWNQRSGRSRELTSRQELTVESSPSISPDGCCVAFSTWDGMSGTISTIDMDGGQEEVVVRDSALFVHPAWSPDKRRIVAVRVGNPHALSPRPTAFSIVEIGRASGVTTEIYTGTHSRRFARQLSGHPVYNDTGDRIMIVVHEREESRLVSIGRDMPLVAETVLRTTPAEELAVSPDGEKVAVAANAATYIVELDQQSFQRIDLTSYPTLSKRPSYFLTWHGDDGMVSCLFTSCKVRSLSTGMIQTLDLHNTAAVGDTKRSKLVLLGGRVMTMGARGTHDPGAVVVTGDRISYVGPRSRVPIPADATIIDVPGTVIMPGLIDTHAHIGHWPPELVHLYSWVMRAYVDFGVTTIYDPQPAEVTIAALKDLVQSGRMSGPNILSSGAPAFGERYASVFPDMVARIRRFEDAATAVERAARFGTGPIKVYSQASRLHRRWLAETASRRGLPITGEGACSQELVLTMVVDGYSSVEHSIPGPIYNDVKELLRHSGISYTPTLTVACGSYGSLGWFANSMGAAEKTKLASMIPQDHLMSRVGPATDTLTEAFWVAARSAAKLAAHGVGVTIGGHGEVPGLGTIWEIMALQMGGLSAAEALKAATIDGARKLGISTEVGSLEVGKRADLIVLAEDPARDTRNLLSVVGLLLDGRWRGTNAGGGVQRGLGATERRRRQRIHTIVPVRQPSLKGGNYSGDHDIVGNCSHARYSLRTVSVRLLCRLPWRGGQRSLVCWD